MSFFQKLVTAGTPESSKRWLTVVLGGIFAVINIVCIVIFIILFIETKQFKATTYTQETIDGFYNVFKQVISADVGVIMFGIGAIALTNITGDLSSILGGSIVDKVKSIVKPAATPAPAPAPAQKVVQQTDDNFVIPILDEE